MDSTSNKQEIYDFSDLRNFVFTEESLKLNFNVTDKFEGNYEQRELSLINFLLSLIESKRENALLKNRLKNLEKVLSKNLIDKYTRMNIEINSWMITDKDKNIKAKLNAFSLENNINNNNNNYRNNLNRKNFLNIKAKETESIEKDPNSINVNNNSKNYENASVNSYANNKIKSNKLKEAKNNKKNMKKMEIEDFSLTSKSNNNFNFEPINMSGFENKEFLNFFTNKSTMETGDGRKIKSNIKKVKK